MNFRDYYTGLPAAEREVFAAKALTSTGYCSQIAYGKKSLELGMADVFVAAGGGALTLDELPLTDRAKAQRIARDTNGAHSVAESTSEAA